VLREVESPINATAGRRVGEIIAGKLRLCVLPASVVPDVAAAQPPELAKAFCGKDRTEALHPSPTR
jgi:hypothetical protein